MNYLCAGIDVVSNACSLAKDIPKLKQTISDYWHKDNVTADDRFNLGFQATGVVLKSTSIVLIVQRMLASAGSESLSVQQKEKLKALLQKELTARILLFSNKIFQNYRERADFSLKEILFEASHLVVNGLQVSDLVGIEKSQYIAAVIDFCEELPAIMKCLQHPHILREGIKDFCFFQYDYFFSAYRLDTIPLDLSPILTHKGYRLIPEEHKRNHVFRHFKCRLSRYPIRYPVIVVDDDGNPMQPMKLFERSMLVDCLTRDIFNYPNTQIAVEFDQVREHLGIRRIIELEMQRLQIE